MSQVGGTIKCVHEDSVTHTERVLIRALSLIRVVQYLPFVPFAVFGGLGSQRYGLWLIMVFSLGVAWSTALFLRARRRVSITTSWFAGDIAVHALIVAIVPRLSSQGGAIEASGWILGPATGAALVVAIYGTRRAMTVGIAALSAAYGLGIWTAIQNGSDATTAATHVLVLVAFAAVARLVASVMRGAARTAEGALAQIVRSQRSHASTQARLDEKTRQHRMLHDTVLPTLSGIASGALDGGDRQVRERCARDADYVRGLIMSDHAPRHDGLRSTLELVAHRHADFGLSVRTHIADLPDEVPEDVVGEVSMAVTEALNNVVAHARTPHAWLHADSDSEGVVTVRVTDRGTGFAQERMPPGTGIRQSVKERMRGVGGVATVHSHPGEGTTVEIQWPA